jgi:ABC-type protease/lipase transport system fused ATPase/permease subunit
MGIMAVVGASLLLIVALFNQIIARKPLETANAASFASEQLGTQIRSESEMVHSLGLREAAFDRWQLTRGKSLDSSIVRADTSGTFTALTKAFRLFLQSLIDQLSPGAMIAAWLRQVAYLRCT